MVNCELCEKYVKRRRQLLSLEQKRLLSTKGPKTLGAKEIQMLSTLNRFLKEHRMLCADCLAKGKKVKDAILSLPVPTHKVGQSCDPCLRAMARVRAVERRSKEGLKTRVFTSPKKVREMVQSCKTCRAKIERSGLGAELERAMVELVNWQRRCRNRTCYA